MPPIVISLDSESEDDQFQHVSNQTSTPVALPHTADKAEQAAQRLERNVADYYEWRPGNHAAAIPQSRPQIVSELHPFQQQPYISPWAPSPPNIQMGTPGINPTQALYSRPIHSARGPNGQFVPTQASAPVPSQTGHLSAPSNVPQMSSTNAIDSIVASSLPGSSEQATPHNRQISGQPMGSSPSTIPGHLTSAFQNRNRHNTSQTSTPSLEGETMAIRDFSISSMKPRFKLNEADLDFHSSYRDKQLTNNFKMHLDRYLRSAMSKYEGQMPAHELLKTATKHARSVFRAIARLKQDRKRAVLAAGTRGRIHGGLEAKLSHRVRYLKKKDVSNSRVQKPPTKRHNFDALSEDSSSQESAEEDILEPEVDTTESDSADFEVPITDSAEASSSTGPRSSPRRRRGHVVEYNLKKLSKASKRARSPERKLRLQPVPKKPRLANNNLNTAKEIQPLPVRIQKRSSILRARELGVGHFGSFTDGKGLQQDLERLTLQDLKPWRHWAGASKDILTAAWTPDGSTYAVGSSADLDDLNLQYNRPKNLLFGKVIENTIYELSGHYIDRPRPETIQSGSNSWTETYNSVDPKLFTTVSSLCFDHLSERLYTASFDKTVKVWDIKAQDRPSCTASLGHASRVSILALGQDSALLATAQYTYDRPIQVYKIQDQPVVVRHYQPERSKHDLNLYPSALRWGSMSHSSHLLAAGFAENKVDEDEREREGYIGVWDVVHETQHRVTPSTQTIFDITWHPFLPIFAAASTTGNRTKLTDKRNTHSLVRVYSPLEGVNCQREYECPAIDINEVLFHPKNEHYVSASCTDGVTYIWDNRRPDVILHRLRHGEPHDPLNYRTRGAMSRAREREELDTGVRFVSWDEWGTRLYTGSSDGIVKVWNPLLSPEDAFVKDLVKFDSNIMTGQFSPDNSNLLVGLSKGSIQILSSAPPTFQLTDSADYLPASTDDEPLVFKPADVASSDEENEGTLASQALLDSGEISIHPVFGAGKGPAYQGPYSRQAREGVAEHELASTDLDPAWLVAQLYPDVRKAGRKMGAVASEHDKKTYRANDVVSWARWIQYHPEEWANIQKEESSKAHQADRDSMARAPATGTSQDKMENSDEPFWGGPSTATSRCQSPDESQGAEDPATVNGVLAGTASKDTPVARSMQAMRDMISVPHGAHSPQNGEQSLNLVPSTPSVPTKTSTGPAPDSAWTKPSRPEWKEPPQMALTFKKQREQAREKARKQATAARTKGQVINLSEE